jgi:glycerate-2-kinase
VPTAVADYLKNAGPEHETPKPEDLAANNLDSFILVKSASVCEAAAAKATELGFNSMILSTVLEGESKELGRTFAAVAREIISNQRPLKAPCAVIGGGETTVKIDGASGEGGPNQEFALAAAPGLDRIGRVVIVGLDSDGSDGPTDIAGAIADDQTQVKANELKLDLFAALMAHNVLPIFRRLGDQIETGATGTNVNDLKMMLISQFTNPTNGH